MSKYVCAGCGKTIVGSMRGVREYPYCGPCWDRVWHDDPEGFRKFLVREHEHEWR